MNSILIKLSLICVTFATICLNTSVESRKDKIKLKDIQVLTLKPNLLTTGRRSKPVPQLQCVGGYCDAIKGQTVQCYNRGSDGQDVQWECKTQINNNYKFGSIDVICEGYDYANDDYVLIGSCGLEYAIDSIDPNIRSEPNVDNTYSYYKTKPSNGVSFGFIVVVVIIIFVIYKTCLQTPNPTTDDRRRTPGAPPPPGFRSDYYDGSDGCAGSSTGAFGFGHQRPNTNANNGNNGFFTGMFTGGALGYLFGSRNNTNYRDQSSYFGSRANPSSYFSTPSSNTRSSSSSTTTTSGFGGTKRR